MHRLKGALRDVMIRTVQRQDKKDCRGPGTHHRLGKGHVRRFQEGPQDCQEETETAQQKDRAHQFAHTNRRDRRNDNEKDEDDINQVGSSHYCVINGKDFDFTTIKPEADNEILAYGEVLKDPGPVKYLESTFFVSKNGNDKSVLEVVIRVTVKWRLQLILLPLLKKKVKQQAAIVIAGLHDGLEKYLQIVREEERTELAEIT